MAILQAHDCVIFFGMFVVVFVNFQSQRDDTCAHDAEWVRWVRHGMFTLLALAAAWSIYGDMSPLSTLLLEVAAVGQLSITALVLLLRKREPPNAGPTKVPEAFSVVARARQRRSF